MKYSKRNIVHSKNNRTTWLERNFDFTHGCGWFCQIYDEHYNIGFGFSKNKFTAYRTAINNLKSK
jgi:hypothetical protein